MKKEIRKNILALRREIPLNLQIEKSKLIIEKVIQHPAYQNAQCVICYIDAKGEVKTGELIEHAWKHGKQVAVPKVHGNDMKFYYISSYEQLESGTFGIPEPKISCPELTCIPENSVVIMPGVAFDMNGNRIGYGKGYYDRYFAVQTNLYKIALAFSMQIVPEIISDSFDIRADYVITEN